MTKSATTKQSKTWTKPELARLGKIADVAGAVGGTTQGGGNKS